MKVRDISFEEKNIRDHTMATTSATDSDMVTTLVVANLVGVVN